MKRRFCSVVLSLSLIPGLVFADHESTGYNGDTSILETDGEICPGAQLVQNDDGSFENGYLWHFGGSVEPDYGSWAECYNSEFICGIQFAFTQNGGQFDYAMDVWVWDSDTGGNPPPGPDPGNVICALMGSQPGPIGNWPEITLHDVQICCETGGEHFVGFWIDAPGGPEVWFIASDEDGPDGCPRTKIAPGIGYPTGWNHPNIVTAFANCTNLGIREFAGPGDCEPIATEQTTWGRIKALY